MCGPCIARFGSWAWRSKRPPGRGLAGTERHAPLLYVGECAADRVVRVSAALKLSQRLHGRFGRRGKTHHRRWIVIILVLGVVTVVDTVYHRRGLSLLMQAIVKCNENELD